MASKSYRKFMATGLSAAVVASVVAPVAGAAAYDDVKEGAWYEEAINYVTEMEYMQGTGKGFEPGADMTRAQAAQLFANILGLDGKGLKADFSDVKEGAWYYEAIAAVKEHGVMSGSGAKFNPNATLTRGEMAAIIVRAYDLKDHEGRDHSFTDIEDNMFRTEIAILADLGIVDGVSAGKFAPKAEVTRAQMASFIFKTEVPPMPMPEVTSVKAVDTKTVEVTVEGAWTQEEVDALVEAGYELTVEGKASHKVGKVTVKAAQASTSADTTTLVLSEIAPELVAGEALSLAVNGEKVEGSEFKYEAPVVTPEVTSVSANNLKEVTVNFNNAVSKADVELTNFSVKNNTVSAVSVSEDKKSVVLTLGTATTQQSDVEVTTKKTLKFENGSLLADDVVKSVNVTDVSIPVAQTIELTGPNTFEITFSEPVKATDSASILINNGVYGVTSKNLSTDGRTLTVTLSASSLTEGTYEVKASGYADYANFSAMSKTFSLEYKKDVTAASVKLVSASQSEVVVEFDKAVTQEDGSALNANYFYHTYSAWKPVAVETTDNKKFTLKFSDTNPATQDFILPEGSVKVTVLKSANDKAVVDMWGNKVAEDTVLTATISADKTAPTVSKVEAKTEDTLVVTFSEKVNTAAANFVIKADGKNVSQTITNVDFDADKLTATLTLSGKLAGGNYTVDVKDVTDTSLSANKITAITLPFTVTDKTAMDLSAVDVKVVDNATAKEQYLYVTFPEAVSVTGANSALSKDNYLVGGNALASGDKVELFGSDNKRVKITVKYRGTTPAAVVDPGTTQLTLGRIADAAGNIPTALSTNVATADDTAPTTFTAKATGLNKLELVFDAELKTVTADGILVDGSDVDAVTKSYTTVAAIDKVEVKDGKTYVTVTVKASDKLVDKSATELAKLSVTVADDKLETITGKKLSGVTAVEGTVVDAIAPELEATTPVTLARTDLKTATISLNFDEDLDVLHNLASTDLVVTDVNGKVYIAGKDYSVNLNATDASILEVVLGFEDEAALDKLNGTKFTVSTKSSVNYLDDEATNTIATFSGKTTATALENN